MSRLTEALRETRSEIATGFGIESRSSGRPLRRRALQFVAPLYTVYDTKLRARHANNTTVTPTEKAIAASAAAADMLVLASAAVVPGVGTAITKLSTNLISHLIK